MRSTRCPDAERRLDALLADVEARAQALARAGTESLAEAETRRGEDAARLEPRGRARSASGSVTSAQRERTLDARAREQARAYLLEARKTVEAALGQARAAVDEATAREARRMLERAIAEAKDDGQADGRIGGSERARTSATAVRTRDGVVGARAGVADGRAAW